jgi:hypothetical protein
MPVALIIAVVILAIALVVLVGLLGVALLLRRRRLAVKRASEVIRRPQG